MFAGDAKSIDNSCFNGFALLIIFEYTDGFNEG